MASCNACLYNPVLGTVQRDGDFYALNAQQSTTQVANVCQLNSCPSETQYIQYQLSANTAIAANTQVTVLFDMFIEGSLTGYDSTTGAFTAPVAGFYFFSAELGYTNLTGAVQLTRILVTPGNNHSRTQDLVNLTGIDWPAGVRSCASNVIYLEEGEATDVARVLFQGAGGQINTNSKMIVYLIKPASP